MFLVFGLSPTMSPTSQYWSSKPQVIMVATVSLTTASTSTSTSCMTDCVHLFLNNLVSIDQRGVSGSYPRSVQSLLEGVDHIFIPKASDLVVLAPAYQRPLWRK